MCVSSSPGTESWNVIQMNIGAANVIKQDQTCTSVRKFFIQISYWFQSVSSLLTAAIEIVQIKLSHTFLTDNKHNEKKFFHYYFGERKIITKIVTLLFRRRLHSAV